MAALTMMMLGVAVPERTVDQPLEPYRESLRNGAFADLTASETGVSTHTCDVVERLLTPGGFELPGEVVVELASAMLLQRTAKAAPLPETDVQVGPEQAFEPSTDTATFGVEAEESVPEQTELTVPPDLKALQFQGDPRTAAFTPIFTWNDRRTGRFFVIYEGERLSVGRDPEVADVVLLDPAISRRHAIISKENGVLMIEDLGSSNGTYVNDQRIATAEIKPGDRVKIGSSRVYMSIPVRDDA
jgi:hypothetical protein